MTQLNTTVVIIDCQTTGMHPNTGDIIQLAWCIYTPTSIQPKILQRWMRLPENVTAPNKIKKLLSIDDETLNVAPTPDDVLLEFRAMLNALKPPVYLMAHFVSFELRFLRDAFQRHLTIPLPSVIPLCTMKLSKQCFPYLPSYTLKALAGYFKYSPFTANEASSHVQLTVFLWGKIKDILGIRNIHHIENLNQPLIKPSNIKPMFLYPVDRAIRLKLPSKPGIYRMVTHDQRVLYIGKATSLKDRVNSYFRGIKNRDKRLLEMLTQACTIQTETCESSFEAELLEACEIKKWKPPYNIALNRSQGYCFYRKDFSEQMVILKATATFLNPEFLEGPFRSSNAINDLLNVHNCLMMGADCRLHGETINVLLLTEGWKIFFARYPIAHTKNWLHPRQLLALGYSLLRIFEKKEGQNRFEQWWASKKKEQVLPQALTSESFAEKIFRLFIRAAICRRQSRTIKRLLGAQLLIHATGRTFHLKNYLTEKLQLNEPLSVVDYYDPLSVTLNALLNKRITIVSDSKHNKIGQGIVLCNQ